MSFDFIACALTGVVTFWAGFFVGGRLGMWSCRQEALRWDLASYHPKTGKFTWKISTQKSS